MVEDEMYSMDRCYDDETHGHELMMDCDEQISLMKMITWVNGLSIT